MGDTISLGVGLFNGIEKSKSEGKIDPKVVSDYILNSLMNISQSLASQHMDEELAISTIKSIDSDHFQQCISEQSTSTKNENFLVFIERVFNCMLQIEDIITENNQKNLDDFKKISSDIKSFDLLIFYELFFKHALGESINDEHAEFIVSLPAFLVNHKACFSNNIQDTSTKEYVFQDLYRYWSEHITSDFNEYFKDYTFSNFTPLETTGLCNALF